MKKFAILFFGVALLTSGSGCCWWGGPFGGYGGYGNYGGYGHNSSYGYGSPNCPGGNCGVPGTTIPSLGIPPTGFYQNSTSLMQPALPGPIPAPITAGLPVQIHPVMPQTAMRYIESLPPY